MGPAILEKIRGDREDAPERAFKIAEAQAALYSPRSTDKAGNRDMTTGNFPR
jgi:hypothetical protein